MSDERNPRTDDRDATENPSEMDADDTTDDSLEVNEPELRRRRAAIDHTVEALCNRLAAGDPTDEDVAAAVREADELVALLRDARRDE